MCFANNLRTLQSPLKAVIDLEKKNKPKNKIQEAGLGLRPHMRKEKLTGISQYVWDTHSPPVNPGCTLNTLYILVCYSSTEINNWTDTVEGISRGQYCLDSFSDNI